MSRFAYDAGFDPPAPVLPLRLSSPGGTKGIVVPMLVDTGADCTLIPATVAKALELPRVGSLEIVGVGGTERTAYVHAALVEFAGRRLLARVVPFDHEAILGRDLLNGIVIVMDGPKRVLQVRRKR